MSDLHRILVNSLRNTIWTRSTRDEDNYRHVLCSSIYKFISADNVEIPSTASGHGDIKIFERRIELKYASNNKIQNINVIIEDLELLFDDKIEFFIVSVRPDTTKLDYYVHRCISMPMLAKTPPKSHSQPQSTLQINPTTTPFEKRVFNQKDYNYISIFLPATYAHSPINMGDSKGKGKKSTAYLSWMNNSGISRSSFLETPFGLIHVDVIGSKEDGLISLLYKKADKIKLSDISNPPDLMTIEIKRAGGNIKMAEVRMVNVTAEYPKDSTWNQLDQKMIEGSVPVFKIY